MDNPVCAVCGHINRLGAVTCEACDAHLYAGEEGADDFQGGRRPFDWSSEASSTASETYEPSGAWAPPRDGYSSPGEDIPSPPFHGAGDVISPMLAVYRKHFTLVGILVLVTMVPEALIQYGLLNMGRMGIGSMAVSGGSSQSVLASVIGASLLLSLLRMVWGALLSGSLTYAVVDLQRAGRSSAGECLARGLKALPKVFLVTLLYGIIVSSGYVLLIVPGIIFSLMFAVSVPAAVVEGLSPMAALKRSHELTKGNKGLIFMTFFLWWLLIIGLSWVVTWSFANGGNLGLLPTLLLQTAVLGMLNSTLHVLTVYIYLGLLREHRSGFQANPFTSGTAAR